MIKASLILALVVVAFVLGLVVGKRDNFGHYDECSAKVDYFPIRDGKEDIAIVGTKKGDLLCLAPLNHPEAAK